MTLSGPDAGFSAFGAETAPCTGVPDILFSGKEAGIAPVQGKGIQDLYPSCIKKEVFEDSTASPSAMFFGDMGGPDRTSAGSRKGKRGSLPGNGICTNGVLPYIWIHAGERKMQSAVCFVSDRFSGNFSEDAI